MIRKANAADISNIMEIIDEAKVYFKANGINQWQEGYPNAETLAKDIALGESFVITDDIDDLETIIGTFCLAFGTDINYGKTFDGVFRSDEPYAAIHRIAIKDTQKGRGRGGEAIEFAVRVCLGRGIKWLRADTHEMNKSMQKMLTKNGFVQVCVIYLDAKYDDGHRRIAFDMKL